MTAEIQQQMRHGAGTEKWINIPQNQGWELNGENQGSVTNISKDSGTKTINLKEKEIRKESNQSNSVKTGVTVIENKKRRTDDGLGLADDVNKNTELDMGLDEDDVISMEQETQDSPKIIKDPKNVPMESLTHGVRKAS